MCEISFIYNECGIYFLKRQRGLPSCLFRKYILHDLYINDISHILYVLLCLYPLSEFAYNMELFDTSVITTTPREQTELHVPQSHVNKMIKRIASCNSVIYEYEAYFKRKKVCQAHVKLIGTIKSFYHLFQRAFRCDNSKFAFVFRLERWWGMDTVSILYWLFQYPMVETEFGQNSKLEQGCLNILYIFNRTTIVTVHHRVKRRVDSRKNVTDVHLTT